MWYSEATKSNVSKYYDYVLIYKDCGLVVSENPGSVLLKYIGNHFNLKEYLIVPPSHYLGVKM